MKTFAVSPKANHLARLLAAALLLISLAASGNAQDGLQGQTPLALAPGSPAGSYSLSGFDTINLFNGNLNFNLPLLHVGGRGGAQTSANLAISHKWTVKSYMFEGSIYYYPEESWWEPKNEYGPGILVGRAGGWGDTYCAVGENTGYENYLKTLTRLTFTTPDGTEYELRDQLTGGRPVDVPNCSSTNFFSRGTVFVTADGTSATFTSDTAIMDEISPYADGMLFPSGYLMLRDGTRYRIDGGQVTWMRDRNGNKLTYTYGNTLGSGAGRIIKITDSLNREVTFAYDVNDVAPYGLCDVITFKGFGGADRKVRVSHTSMSNALRAGNTIQTHAQLFPELNGADSTLTFNPTVASAVWLPDDPNDPTTARKYSFYYNSYGELARVVLPTGGAIEYDWAAGVAGGNASGSFDAGVYRRVVTRREYTNGAALTQTMTISRPESTTDNINFSNLGYVDVQFGSAVWGKSRHYFYGQAISSFWLQATDYSPWKEGREYRTESFAADGTTVLRRVEHTLAQRAAVSWWTGLPDNEPSNDPRITQTVTTLVDTNQVTKQSAIDPQTLAVGFDQYNNQTDVYEYDYGVGAPGALVRHSHTDFLTTNVVGGTTYNYATDTTIHLRSLPKQTFIYDAAGAEQARTTYEYDNYTATANHAGLTARSLISGLDSAYTTSKKTRGNVTATTRYLLSGGSVTGSVSAYRQYDVAGNVVKAVDSLGNITTFGFADSFGGPDAEARLNSTPPELVTQSGVLQSYAFPSWVRDDMGHTTYAQRDYYTGLAVDAEDQNGVTSSGYYEDYLDRPTKVIRAASDTASRNQTTFTYDDTLRVITTATDFDAFNDATPLKSQLLYDGLGRTTETRTFETATTYIAVRKTYDTLGRVNKVSNPFRTGTPVWTTTAYDSLGRVTSVTTPDNASVTTSYSGNATTVTDQTGRDRQTTTDGLGRLTQVIEDPGTGGLGYSTTYAYDVLGNLRKVTQGSQSRYFMYDSLSRLIRVRQPEQSTLAALALTDPVTGNGQWSIAYAYDDNGNILTRTDARNLVTEYGYDDLNRNTTVTYKSGTVTQAHVSRTYDTAPNGVGRPAAAFYYVDTGTNAGANSQTAVDSYDAMGRPLSQSQYFYSGGAWGTAFTTQRTYNLAGAVTSQTYPSGRTVTYAYDLAGRTSSFTGNLGDGVARNYATTITYDQWGGLSREKFGTTTPLYHKERRNARGQLYDMRLSTVNDADNWNRGAITNYYSVPGTGPNLTAPDNTGTSGADNNGGLYVQQHWVPNDDAITSSSFMQQNYVYDELNRLRSVTESPNGNTAAPSGSQLYTYDRYGNRTLDPASSGTGINEQQFTVSAANNRLGVPTGQTGVMQYDAAGNLYNDTYSGTGSRTFDHENRMVTATNTAGQQSVYTYDADGQRVRRKSYGVETWQVYGLGGDLLAEYASGTAPASPQKEYGYRSGQLLVTAEAAGRVNVALASAGGVATASSQYSSGTGPDGAINGDRRGLNWGSGGGWADSATTPFPEWVQVDFAGTKTIDEIDVVGLQDGFATLEPTETMTFTQYGLTDFEVQYWNGSAWVTVTGGSVTGNDKVWRKFTFAAVSTSKVRVYITGGVGGRARLIELEAWQSASAAADVRWLVPDQLGTPRMTADKTGSLAGITRHDYLPFGEELLAGTGNRTATKGYAAGDDARQKFTGYERDDETGLDYARARYYASTQGRFTAVDPLLSSGRPGSPQTWNRYAYVLNNPLGSTDPTGMEGGANDPYLDQSQQRQPVEQQPIPPPPPPPDFTQGTLTQSITIENEMYFDQAHGVDGATNETTVVFSGNVPTTAAKELVGVRDFSYKAYYPGEVADAIAERNGSNSQLTSETQSTNEGEKTGKSLTVEGKLGGSAAGLSGEGGTSGTLSGERSSDRGASQTYTPITNANSLRPEVTANVTNYNNRVIDRIAAMNVTLRDPAGHTWTQPIGVDRATMMVTHASGVGYQDAYNIARRGVSTTPR